MNSTAQTKNGNIVPAQSGQELPQRKDISFRLKEKNAYIGVTVDELSNILFKGEEVGVIATSVWNDHSLYIEWVCLNEDWRGKHLMRGILENIGEGYELVRFTCGAELLPMYEHLGAEQVGFDDCSEMYEMKYSA